MTRSHRVLLLTVVLGFSVSAASAQVQTGTPPFGSFGGGPEVINLGNLNAHFTIPVLHKPGRGLNFTYDLSYDSSVWFKVTSGGTTTWQPVQNWGWRAATEAATGYISDSGTVTGTCNPSGHANIPGQIIVSNWVYHDPFGISHAFSGSATINTGNCPAYGGPNSTGFTSTATDGSGYKLVVTGSPTTTILVRNVFAVDGTNETVQENTGTGAASGIDRNGNQITVSGSGVFTDTLGTAALTVAGVAPSNTTFTYSYTKPDGTTGTNAYTMVYTTQSVQTNFGCNGVSDVGPMNISLVSEIDLPDGSKYTFTYESTPTVTGKVTGRIKTITLPAGGQIIYTYTGGSSGNITCSDGSASGFTRQTPDGTWTYARTMGSGAASATKVTAPKLSYDAIGNDTIIQFQGIYETQRNVYQGSAPAFSSLPIPESTLLTPNMLQEMQTCYNGAASPCVGTAISLPITQVAQITQLDVSGLQSKHVGFFNSFGLPTEYDDYDYGNPAPLTTPLKKTLISYAALGNNINASQQTITVCNGTGTSSSCNGSGTVVAQTQYNYDETGAIGTSGTPQHGTVSGSRGNLTTFKRLVQGTTYLSKTYSYYDTGNVKVATDPAGAQTTYTYGACGNSFPTQQVTVTGSLSLSNSMTWDCTGGVLTSTIDTNNQATNYSYDSLWRPTVLKRPDNVQLTYQYPTQTSPTYVVTTPIQGTNSAVSTTTLDSLGRPNRTTTTDNSQNTYSIVDTQYDELGRGYKISNPYTSGTQYWTATQFDALGRMTSQIQQDGAQTTYSYSGKTTTVADPAGKQRKYDYDVASRIVNAWEPDPTQNNSLTVQTSYTYTAADQISGIAQGVQSRTYNYDLMGRLTSVTTPESGQISFLYNSAGLVSQKTDARGVQTNYVYDGLSRITGRNYTIPQGNTSAAMPNVCDPAGNPTPTQNVCYYYDQGGSAAYALGRLTKIADTSGSETYTFDQLGRTTQVSKTVGSTTYSTQYQFNLANQPTTITYPSGRVLQGTYDAIGRLCAIGASGSTCSSGTTYATGLAYNPAGQLTSVTYGNGVIGTFGYSADRLQLTSIGYAKGAQTLAALSYWYKQDATNCVNGINGNNGQIQCINDSVDSGRNASYTYDALYRLISASTTGSTAYPKWHLTWGYDRYGNRLNQTVQSDTSPNLQPPAPSNSLSFANPGGAQTNRQDSMCFDLSGNLLAETSAPCPSPTYVYDGENHLVSYQSASYTYDAAGIRVKKQSGSTTTVYIFSGSKVIAEYDNGAAVTSPSREYIYSGARLLAKFEGGATNYFHNDHLSARVVADSSGNVLGQRGHYPFGETWYETGTTTKWKFTTYERDSESTNDYALARSFVNRFGRFSSPDPLSGGLDDPQSLNRYTYAGNDPCNQVDPLGLATCTFNVKITNDSGAQLDLGAVASRMNDILGKTQDPDGNSVNITTSFSGNSDYAVNLTYSGSGFGAMVFGRPGTYGITPPLGLGGSFIWVSNIASDLPLANSNTSLETAVGSAAAHELGHQTLPWYTQIGGMGDIQYDPKNPGNTNIMMLDSAGSPGAAAILGNPDNPFWQFSPKQIAQMYKDCIKKHPPKAPATNANSGRGGGGGGGGSRDPVQNQRVQCQTTNWDIFSGVICTDGSGCFMGFCGCEPDFARPGITPCNVAGIDLRIFSRPTARLPDRQLFGDRDIALEPQILSVSAKSNRVTLWRRS